MTEKEVEATPGQRSSSKMRSRAMDSKGGEAWAGDLVHPAEGSRSIHQCCWFCCDRSYDLGESLSLLDLIVSFICKIIRPYKMSP